MMDLFGGHGGLGMGLFSGHEIIMEFITDDMNDWLEKTCPGRYLFTPNMIRFKYAGPNVPMDECERQEGTKILFEDEKELLLFKVAWG